jgi:Peptidase family M23
VLWVPAAHAWTWPVDGPVVQGFAFDPAQPYAGGQHRGVDIGAPAGAPVVAPASGSVTFAGSTPTNGLTVSIETADGLDVSLTHLGSLEVAKGDAVAEGAVVGAVGPSGAPEVEGPYVHLGIRPVSDANGYLDPLSLLPSAPPQSAPASASDPASASAAAPAAAQDPALTTPAVQSADDPASTPADVSLGPGVAPTDAVPPAAAPPAAKPSGDAGAPPAEVRSVPELPSARAVAPPATASPAAPARPPESSADAAQAASAVEPAASSVVPPIVESAGADTVSAVADEGGIEPPAPTVPVAVRMSSRLQQAVSAGPVAGPAVRVVRPKRPTRRHESTTAAVQVARPTARHHRFTPPNRGHLDDGASASTVVGSAPTGSPAPAPSRERTAPAPPGAVAEPLSVRGGGRLPMRAADAVLLLALAVLGVAVTLVVAYRRRSSMPPDTAAIVIEFPGAPDGSRREAGGDRRAA